MGSEQAWSLTAVFALFLFAALGLVLAIGVAEAHRTYPLLQLQRLEAQGGVVAGVLESHLSAGIPLDQISGFEPLTRPLMHSSPDLEGIEALGRSQELVFATRRLEPDPAPSALGEGDRTAPGNAQETLEAELPLRTRFEAVGNLRLLMSQGSVGRAIEKTLEGVARSTVLFGALALAFVAVALRLRPQKSRLIFTTSFTLCLLAVSAVLFGGLVELYSRGVAAKTEALVASLGKRLGAPMDLGLRLEDLSGLDETLRSYLLEHGEIEAIRLVDGETVLLHSDPARVGTEARPRKWTFESSFLLRTQNAESLELVFVVPKTAIYKKLWGASKNLIALFVALMLISRLPLALLISLAKSAWRSDGRKSGHSEIPKVQILQTFTVLMEGLCLPVMATWLASSLAGQGWGAGAVSLVFTAFFAGHALILLPAGRFARRFGAQPLILAGTSCAVIGWLGLCFSPGFASLVLLRALGGVGQGLCLIGSQTALLSLSRPDNKTRNLSFLVLAYQTGMISGTAFGSLLAHYAAVDVVFYVAALLGLLNLWLGKRFLRLPVSHSPRAPQGAAPATAPSDPRNTPWKTLLKDRGLMLPAVCVGIPTKVVAAGFIFFSLPLTLSQQGFSADGIGQVLMLYAVGVLLSNLTAGRAEQRLGGTRPVLMLGMGLAALSLGLLALGSVEALGCDLPSTLRTALVVLGAWGLGAGHGWIHAPVLSHVATSPSARRLGAAEVSSAFRFLERLGSVAGPVLAGVLLGIGGVAYGVAALAVLVLAWFFLKQRTHSLGEPAGEWRTK
ncbi:MAG: MFS transporter [Acidobacteriota bacterium]